MGSPTKQARAERRAMIALVAVFVLVAQALVPAFAATGPMPDGANLICTAMGVQQAPDDGAPPAADRPCKHGVCPASADLPPVVARVSRVAYAVVQTPAAAANRTPPPPARGPPRPPGQGPPTSDA